MRLARQFDSLLGKRWILRSAHSLELSPEHDPLPGPMEVISIAELPLEASVDRRIGEIERSIAPSMWAGRIDRIVPSEDHDMGIARVVDNPLQGPILFVVKRVAKPDSAIFFTYENNADLDEEEVSRICDALTSLGLPLFEESGSTPLIDAATLDTFNLPDLERSIAGFDSIAEGFGRAKVETNLFQKYVILTTVIGSLLNSRWYVRTLSPEAYADLVRATRGLSTVLSPAVSPETGLLTASMLARVLVSHSAVSAKKIERGLSLARLIAERAQSSAPERWEEAILTDLLGRAAQEALGNTEDYGRLNDIAEALQARPTVANRVLLRLIYDGDLKLENSIDAMITFNRCEIAIFLLQQIDAEGEMHGNLEAGGTDSQITMSVGDEQINVKVREGALSMDAILGAYGDLPDEFSVPPPVEADSPIIQSRFSVLIPAIQSKAMETIYQVDHETIQAKVRAYTERHFADFRHTILLLRGFRAAKRCWVRNNFKDSSQYVLPGYEKAAVLSLEAALERGLGPFSCIAVGGSSDPFGMARLQSWFNSDDTWKDVVKTQSKSAGFILILPDVTAALIWEIDHLCAQGYLSKVVLIMPPIDVDRNALQSWRLVSDQFAKNGVHLPDYEETGAFVALAEDLESCQKHGFETLYDGTLCEILVNEIPCHAARD